MFYFPQKYWLNLKFQTTVRTVKLSLNFRYQWVLIFLFISIIVFEKSIQLFKPFITRKHSFRLNIYNIESQLNFRFN